MNTNPWSHSNLRAREHTITALLGVCRGYVQYYSSSSGSSISQAERPLLEDNDSKKYGTSKRDYKEHCDTLMFELLIKGMGIGLFPFPANASEIFMSVSTMAYRLSTIYYALADRENAPSRKYKLGHALCLNANRLLELTSSAVRTSHHKYIEDQSKKRPHPLSEIVTEDALVGARADFERITRYR